MIEPICLWSGPRNVSTALMYSFAQRNNVRVLDEPLYGHYLRVTGTDHPGRDEVLAVMNQDGDAVMRDLLAAQRADPAHRLFLKHMAHHLVDLDLGFLAHTTNLILVRDPREMLPSLTVQMPHAQLTDTGLKRAWELLADLRAQGQSPVVLDSRELLLDPAGVLAELCARLDLEFDDAMLHWEAGPRPEDGVWARHWYHALHKSTGWSPYVPKTHFPEHLGDLLDECRPWYEKLYAHARMPVCRSSTAPSRVAMRSGRDCASTMGASPSSTDTSIACRTLPRRLHLHACRAATKSARPSSRRSRPMACVTTRTSA